jgi:hypothetical protein
MVLLHEMCHARIGRGGHGQRFLAELKHLVELGELWAASHQDLYDDPKNRMKGMQSIRQFMTDWMMSSSDRVPGPWAKARVRVAHSFGMSVTELYRRYPSARKAWYQLLQRKVRDAESDARLSRAIETDFSEETS